MSYLKAENPFVIRTYKVGDIVQMAQTGLISLKPAYQR